MYRVHILSCAFKLLPTYGDPNKASKVCEVFKEWFTIAVLQRISLAKQVFEPMSPESESNIMSSTLHLALLPIHYLG